MTMFWQFRFQLWASLISIVALHVMVDAAGGRGAAAQEPTPLTLGRIVEGRIVGGETKDFAVQVDEAGLLMVGVRSLHGEDVSFMVVNENDQPVGDGFDIDYRGNLGAEHGVVIIPSAGSYRVRVRAISDSADFVVGAAWLRFPHVAIDAAPDAPDETAIELTVGQHIESELDSDYNERSKWFRFAAQENGFLTVITRGSGEADLVMEAFTERDLSQRIAFSDGDSGGNFSNESVTFDVNRGETYFIKVHARYLDGQSSFNVYTQFLAR